VSIAEVPMKHLIACGLLVAVPGITNAQNTDSSQHEMEEIVVLAHPLSAEGLAQATR
jgi:hypothetical protein